MTPTVSRQIASVPETNAPDRDALRRMPDSFTVDDRVRVRKNGPGLRQQARLAVRDDRRDVSAA